jgi:hypothetical protein
MREICGLFPETLKARSEAILRTLNPEECGVPFDERAALVESARRRVREIEEEHTALVRACAAFNPPIEMALLETVRARLPEEGRRRNEALSVSSSRRY